MSDISLKIKKLRKSLGLTQEDFAHKSKISRSTLAQIETGKIQPTFAAIEKICTTFGVDANEFVGAKEITNHPQLKGAVVVVGEDDEVTVNAGTNKDLDNIINQFHSIAILEDIYYTKLLPSFGRLVKIDKLLFHKGERGELAFLNQHEKAFAVFRSIMDALNSKERVSVTQKEIEYFETISKSIDNSFFTLFDKLYKSYKLSEDNDVIEQIELLTKRNKS